MAAGAGSRAVNRGCSKPQRARHMPAPSGVSLRPLSIVAMRFSRLAAATKRSSKP